MPAEAEHVDARIRFEDERRLVAKGGRRQLDRCFALKRTLTSVTGHIRMRIMRARLFLEVAGPPLLHGVSGRAFGGGISLQGVGAMMSPVAAVRDKLLDIGSLLHYRARQRREKDV